MEGKEVRFGIVASALFAVITTAASCGAVNAMHSSFMPLGGMIPLMLIGVVFATPVYQGGTLTFTKPAAWTERAPARLPFPK